VSWPEIPTIEDQLRAEQLRITELEQALTEAREENERLRTAYAKLTERLRAVNAELGDYAEALNTNTGEGE
jgi:uncharacterized coiled-coil protein SlyX